MPLTEASQIRVRVEDQDTGRPIAGVGVQICELMREKNPHYLEILITNAAGEVHATGSDIQKEISITSSQFLMDYRGNLKDALAVVASCADADDIAGRFLGAAKFGEFFSNARLSEGFSAQLRHAASLNVKPVKQLLKITAQCDALDFLLRTRQR